MEKKMTHLSVDLESVSTVYLWFLIVFKAYTRTWKKDGQGQCWESDGSGSYSIDESSDQQRGTKLVIKLKEEFSEFSKEDRVKDIIKKYSCICTISCFSKWRKSKYGGRDLA
jgi:HSP90 family molecular chaperone